MPTPLAILGLLLASAGVACGQSAAPNDTFTIDAILPPFPTDQPDAYLCTSLQLPNRPLKLTGVEAVAEQEVVHHILLFGKLRAGGLEACPLLDAALLGVVAERCARSTKGAGQPQYLGTALGPAFCAACLPLLASTLCAD
jgi:hypothetical protein